MHDVWGFQVEVSSTRHQEQIDLISETTENIHTTFGDADIYNDDSVATDTSESGIYSI